jgi:hypothetical protein
MLRRAVLAVVVVVAAATALARAPAASAACAAAVVVDEGTLRIRTAARTVFARVDAATRFTNRPVYEPVLRGQRLRVTTSRCGPRRVADRVTFVGTPPAPAAYRSGSRAADSRGLDLAAWLIVPAGSAVGPIGLLWRRLGRA